MKIVICGHAQHGKDTLADILKDDYGMDHQSSSMFCIEKFIFSELGPKYEYKTPMDLYLNRGKHRTELFNMIQDYSKDDPTRLTREILNSHDLYVGCRNPEELLPSRDAGLIDLIIWVDASKRKPLEPIESMKIKIEDADIIIDNNGTKEEFENRVHRLMKWIRL